MIAAILVAFVFFATCYYLIALSCVQVFFSRKQAAADDWTPPVSLLKPIKGVDFEAFENLASFVRQEYPTYQVLFGVESERDPVVPLIKRLIEEFPGRDLQLIITGNVKAANRKAGIVTALSRRAKYDLWVISDSDIRVPPNYLREIVCPFKNSEVGMVTCLYRATRAESLAAVIESLIIQLDFFPAVLVSEQMEELRFGLGATMAVRRTAVMAIGGLQSIGEYLADDYQLGYRIHRAGHRVVLSTRIVDVVIGEMQMRELWRHQLRWARTCKVCRPNGYFAIILTHGLFLSTAYLILSDFSLIGWWLFSLNVTMRLSTATVILCRYFKERRWLAALLLLPVIEILSAMLWSAALLGRRVTWRDHTFEVKKDGRLLTLEHIR